MAQHRPKRLGKGHTSIDRHLVDALDRVFDWVFKRDDVFVLGTNGTKQAIKGGCFAAAGRARDQDQAAGLMHRRKQIPLRPSLNTKLRQTKVPVRIEKPHHHLFPVQRR